MAEDTRKTAAQRGYGYRWQQYRSGFLRKHPLCSMCMQMGRITPATVVDHIDPHGGDQMKFWDKANHQALCKQCHDRFKQRLEVTGKLSGCDLVGVPVDPNHHWRRGV